MDWRQRAQIAMALHLITVQMAFLCVLLYFYEEHVRAQARRRAARREKYNRIPKVPDQLKKLRKIVEVSDVNCVKHLSMDRNAFFRLCYLLQHRGGLQDEKCVGVTEQVAMFLSVLTHQRKNSLSAYAFEKPGHMVGKCFKRTLQAVLKLHELFLAKPEPVDADCTSPRWKCFRGCLGALDGNCFPVTVPAADRVRYLSRKRETAINILGMCDTNMKLIYVLSGWEGSASDTRVLNDAIFRWKFKVPAGGYYLCDYGYANKEGFLAPYKCKRYHLKEWGEGKDATQDFQEYFNMKHSKARNVIERAFGLLKKRWGALQGNTYCSVDLYNRIIMACAFPHNFIRTEMPVDPIDDEVEEDDDDIMLVDDDVTDAEPEVISCGPQSWNGWRDKLAQDMWRARR